MAYYPQLNASGMMIQRPSGATIEWATTRNDMDSGKRYAYSWRGAGLTNFPGGPLARRDLQYASITDAERGVLEGFFNAMRGRYGEFAFLDPGGNLVAYSEAFGDASWEKYTAAAGSATDDPFGGSGALTVTGSSSNSMLATYVLPDGGASGFVLTGSIWARSASGGSLAIGFIDSGFTLLSSSTWTLPAGQWRRIWHTTALATASNIRLLIGGLSTWGAVSLDLFGAQCAALPGPGGYMKTPGNYGLHAKCRFDMDALAIRYAGPNENSASVRIVEYF